MMTEEQAIELGKRAMAAGWEWQAGAVDMAGDRVMTTSPRIREWWKDQWEIWGFPAEMFYIGLNVDQPRYGHRMGEICTSTFMQPPDFRDPATLGILLAQVRERWDDATIHAQFYDETWRVAYWNPENFFWAYWPEESFVTEAEALVGCLEAAKESRL